ncbi:unnamed protein product [Calicophoron daubneyi]|uniref:Exocyst complex component Sec8 n=1 Tax=Calicophoron daubneyi TaxID=300641 RepID=A0AAV2TJ13_CALDB
MQSVVEKQLANISAAVHDWDANVERVVKACKLIDEAQSGLYHLMSLSLADFAGTCVDQLNNSLKLKLGLAQERSFDEVNRLNRSTMKIIISLNQLASTTSTASTAEPPDSSRINCISVFLALVESFRSVLLNEYDLIRAYHTNKVYSGVEQPLVLRKSVTHDPQTHFVSKLWSERYLDQLNMLSLLL